MSGLSDSSSCGKQNASIISRQITPATVLAAKKNAP
jgi:hypothetical protein